MLTIKSTSDDPMLQDLGIGAGSKLLAVNDRQVSDRLDYEFVSTEEDLILLIETSDGEQIELEIGFDDLLGLELEFEPDRVRTCRNKCVFCFIHQLPKGLRRTLYVKDEDYRLSFSHGNYVTLTNLSESDFERIESQRLSPLYVSVHTTDEELRRRLLGNDKIPDLMPQLRRLVESGIELHTQIVLCPGWNDGAQLKRTIDDLAALHPSVASVAVVPVGLTRHRSKLPRIDPVTPALAREVLSYLMRKGGSLAESLSCRFVYPADEFFILAGEQIPPSSFYDNFPQVENGVGMVRQLLDSDTAGDISIDDDLSLTVLTGRMVSDILDSTLAEKWGAVGSLSCDVVPVQNEFLGRTVSVSGLLCGTDMIDTAKELDRIGDCIVVPPDCLNDDGLFLDDLTLNDMSKELDRPVVQASYSPCETLIRVMEELSN